MPTATTNSNFENDIDYSDILLVTGAQRKIASQGVSQYFRREMGMDSGDRHTSQFTLDFFK